MVVVAVQAAVTEGLVARVVAETVKALLNQDQPGLRTLVAEGAVLETVAPQVLREARGWLSLKFQPPIPHLSAEGSLKPPLQ